MKILQVAFLLLFFLFIEITLSDIRPQVNWAVRPDHCRWPLKFSTAFCVDIIINLYIVQYPIEFSGLLVSYMNLVTRLLNCQDLNSITNY